MEIFTPKETDPHERRVALVPDTAKKLCSLGCKVTVESNAGANADFSDADYAAAGAHVTTDRSAALASADLVARVRKPPPDEVSSQKKGAMHVSFLDPFNEPELIKSLAAASVTAVSLEMMPRTTLAQKMDAISSQANLAGYSAVIVACQRISKIFPMMMTPAGTLSPAKVFVIGIGVAGLQAIATAKRLGARVTAFDTRKEALEQAESLGAKALRIDLGETGGTDQGYAKELTPGQLGKQRQEQAKVCAQSDIVITTAKLFGRKAPILITRDVVATMARGSVIVDLAAEGGGNVEGTVVYEEVVTENGVRIVGLAPLECDVAQHASLMFSSNIVNFIEHFWDSETKSIKLNLEDEILKSCVITRSGETVHERFKS
jgi:H+-translocating NAD(P) transhydrogenase subunit alpha